MTTEGMDALDKWLARNVMGWKQVDRLVVHSGLYAVRPCWVGQDGEVVEVEYYHPTRSIEQSVRCLEKVVDADPNHATSAIIEIAPQPRAYEVSIWSGPDVAGEWTDLESLPLAICRAIQEAWRKKP